jgi:hypothetical protein
MHLPPLTGFPEAKKTLESPPGKYQGASTTPFFCDTCIRPENTEAFGKISTQLPCGDFYRGVVVSGQMF